MTLRFTSRLCGRSVLLTALLLSSGAAAQVDNASKVPPNLTIRNAALEVTLHSSNATFTVLDRRSNRRFTQQPLRSQVRVLEATAKSDELQLRLLYTTSGLEIHGSVRLEAAAPEFTVELTADGKLT